MIFISILLSEFPEYYTLMLPTETSLNLKLECSSLKAWCKK
jgi:hypothetical protein